MGKGCIPVVLLGLVLLTAPANLYGDYYDSFDDHALCGPDANYASGDPYLMYTYFDPNYSWAIDNPQWWWYPIMAGSGSFVDANSGSLRVFVSGGTLLPILGIAAVVPDNGDQDPCTSPAYWDDTTNHYILVKVKYPGAYLPPPYGDRRNDPNFDRGIAYIFMHGDPDTWTSIGFNIAFHNCSYYNGNPNTPIRFGLEDYWNEHLNLNYTAGANMYNIQRVWIDPNGVRPKGSLDPNLSDPNDTVRLDPPEWNDSAYRIRSMDTTKWLHYNFDAMERNGFWMLCQFEIDPNHSPGDPNGKYLKGAIWEGDKYAWDGTWLLNQQISDPWWGGSAQAEYSYPTVSVGRCGLVTLSATPDLWGGGFPAAAEYDDVEARTDIFNGIARRLDLKITKSQYMSSIKVSPDLRDPNDPNTTDERLYRFTDGTRIVMQATPVSGKAFDSWTIWEDPNKYPDSAFAVTDSNATIYLTMDKHYVVEAAFKCGSGLPPFIAAVFLALGAGIVLRRLS